MGRILVERALGPALIQDAGRPGYARLGVPASGAADPVSLDVGNRLVGNPAAAPAIEIALAGGTFAFDAPASAVLAGSEFEAWIEEPSGERRPLGLWRTARVPAGGRIHVGGARGGARVYLCVAGRLEVPTVLGSTSTYPACGLGGWHGRPLRAGDEVPFAAGGDTGSSLSDDAAAALRSLLRPDVLRVTEGAQRGAFRPESVRGFHEATFRVSRQSDRTGIRLEGPAIDIESAGSMLTEGTPPGAVQVPPGGAPIVLGVDGPTTGGYPMIAAVIAADLPALAHLVPGDPVRFRTTTLDDARRALAELRKLVAGLGVPS